MAQTDNELDAAQYTRLAGFDSDWRDCWWNQDYLELLARRTGLARRTRLLDVGCGVGHWGQRLLPLAHPEATLVGIDREADFLADAQQRAAARGLGDRVRYRHAVAESLPVPDATFDVVTCQTVLMHATDAAAVIAELVRVLVPGGLLLVAEPDNLTNAVSPGRGPHGPTSAEVLALMELHLTCAAGKLALGHGDEGVGSRLFSLFSSAGLAQVRCWTNDRCAPLRPPYAARDQALDVDIIRSSSDFSPVMRDRAERHWRAGGGAPHRFAALWEVRAAREARVRQQVEAHTFERGGGFLMFVCAGEKPEG